MPSFNREIFDQLSVSGPRLDWLAGWLTGSVWSPERFNTLPPVRYLEEGERTVNEVEEIIAAAAPRVYDKLTSVPASRDLSQFLDGSDPAAIVIFDGLSLREVPALLRLAADSGLMVKDSGTRFAEHFAHIQAVLESAWKATVMGIPRGRRILVTSDHGYIYLGAGLSFSRHRDDLRPLSAYLGGERWTHLAKGGEPLAHEDLAVYRERDVAVLRGRVQPHHLARLPTSCTNMAGCR